MKLNPDCVRDIMISLETNLKIDSHGKCIPLSFENIVSLPELSKYEPNEISFVLSELFDFGLLKKGKKYINEYHHQVSGITEKGYQLISAIEPKSNWDKIKSLSAKAGIYSLKSLFDVSLKLIFNI